MKFLSGRHTRFFAENYAFSQLLYYIKGAVTKQPAACAAGTQGCFVPITAIS